MKLRKGSEKKRIKLTVDQSLNKLKGKVLAPKKLKASNELLKRLKSPLPQ